MFSAVHVETKVEKLAKTSTGIEATFTEKSGQTKKETFDRVLVAVGRKPNTRGFGLENTSAQVDEQGFIKVDKGRRTHDVKIYAVGDVTGNPMLAHKASREGRVAAEAIAGEPAAFDNVAIPAVVFSDPEIAWCGLRMGCLWGRG